MQKPLLFSVAWGDRFMQNPIKHTALCGYFCGGLMAAEAHCDTLWPTV